MFDAPRPANSSAPADNYIQPNLNYGLRIWWAFYWRTVLSAFVFAFAFTFIVGSLAGAGVVAPVSKYGGYIFYYLTAFVVMSFILRKNFRHFRIGLLSNHGGEGAQLLAPNLRRTARVWWTFTWRAVVYRIVATIVATIPLTWFMGMLQAIFPDQVAGVIHSVIVQLGLDAAVGMFVIYSSILDEDISDFRVALLPRAESTSPVSTAAAPANLANS